MNAKTNFTPAAQPPTELTLPNLPLPLMPNVCLAVVGDGKAVEDCLNWLSLHRVWGQLPTEVLQAIAFSTRDFVQLIV